MALPGGMALPENEGTSDELLVDQSDPDALLRSEAWKHFTRQAHKVNKCHYAAHCNACTEHGEAQDVGGTAKAMDAHLVKCTRVSPQVKAAAVLRTRAQSEAQQGKRKRSANDIVQESSKRPATVGRQLGLLSVPLQDKPLTAAETAVFEQLLLDALVSANWPLQSAEENKDQCFLAKLFKADSTGMFNK